MERKEIVEKARRFGVAPHLLTEALTYDKVAILRVFIKGDPTPYVLLLTTNDPEVNLQDELCHILNWINAGYVPPNRQMIVYIPKPSGWKKLMPGVYCRSTREIRNLLKAFQEGRRVPFAWDKSVRFGGMIEWRKGGGRSHLKS